LIAKLQNVLNMELVSVETDLPPVWSNQTDDQAQECRFPAATGTDGNNRSLGRDLQMDRTQSLNASIGFPSIVKFNDPMRKETGVTH
jgi:hypothetical protein